MAYDRKRDERIEKFARSVLKNRTIVVDGKLMRGLGYTETRDFFEALHYWGYNTDFGMLPPSADTSIQVYLRHFIRSFID